jgi:uncharacterized protein (DUF885 family)
MPGIENQGVGMKLTRIALLLLSFSCGGAANADATSNFQTLLDEHWEWTLANSPVMASMMGDRRYNQEWSDNSPGAIEQDHVETQAFLRRAYAIDRGALSPDDQLNYELFRRQLQDEVDEHQFEGHLIPFDHQGGIQNLDIMASRLSFNAVTDYDDWIVRLSKIDEVIDQTIALAERGRKKGLVAPAVLMRRMPDQIAVQIVEFAADTLCRTAGVNPGRRPGTSARRGHRRYRRYGCARLPETGQVLQQEISARRARHHWLVVPTQRQRMV